MTGRNPRPRRPWTTLLASLVLLSACQTSGIDAVVCTTEAVFGIKVEVREAATSNPAADGATLTLRDGAYVETVDESFDGLSLAGATERAGTYDVTVEKPGFATWEMTGVQVVMDASGCHVVGVTLMASLTPAA